MSDRPPRKTDEDPVDGLIPEGESPMGSRDGGKSIESVESPDVERDVEHVQKDKPLRRG